MNEYNPLMGLESIQNDTTQATAEFLSALDNESVIRWARSLARGEPTYLDSPIFKKATLMLAAASLGREMTRRAEVAALEGEEWRGN
jgi:hypothetical protein